MITYLARRVLWIIPVLFTVSIITFFLMHSVPGGPWDREKRLPAAVETRLNAQYGLDKPLYEQYINWAGAFIQGDLGPSYRYQDRRVNDIVADGLPTTVQLGDPGVPPVRHHRDPARDLRGARPQPLAGLPLHERLHDRHIHAQLRAGDPAGGRVRRRVRVLPDGRLEGTRATSVLPTIALAGFPIAVIARYTRASMLEVTRKDYIRTAQSKGLRERAVVHAAHDPQRAHPGRHHPRSRSWPSW